MENTNPLGAFLRARRELVSPEAVGITPHGLRRVKGLRREEVATLAGISSDYYLRLEQGRDHNPSVQVLEALAGVLQLDGDATAYLLGLSGSRPRKTVRPAAERVPVSIKYMLAQMPMPAFVHGRYFDVLAANPMARALSPNMAPGVNRLRAAFLDPRERELHRDWAQATVGVVAQLRASAGPAGDDPRLAALVGELSLKSDRFRSLWARHDVRRRETEVSRMRHPKVGDLELYREKLTINGTDGQLLVVYHAKPGSPSAQSLTRLGSPAATE
ncbi:helix-turn-helix transcriptional regulator [Streptomyces durmitorensis]|uniref:Helix-turn-helix transcriptional regulator n=1 Tax=Streptomyces durmitorensis TaxID=319947 RepID=A0ABY4Q3J4_9ACTN|nr:helix-turn-helix transcriptional regulator [Streptomyces durmitorensis]UQT60765.1 helix-turn-helix transcriptional regulator [Streptomyces durmitorensis]